MFSAPTSSISSLKQIAFQACANHYGNDAFAFFSKELDQLEDNFEESNSDHEESKAEKLISFAQENRGIVSELVFIEQACKAVRQLNPNKRKKLQANFIQSINSNIPYPISTTLCAALLLDGINIFLNLNSLHDGELLAIWQGIEDSHINSNLQRLQNSPNSKNCAFIHSIISQIETQLAILQLELSIRTINTCIDAALKEPNVLLSSKGSIYLNQLFIQGLAFHPNFEPAVSDRMQQLVLNLAKLTLNKDISAFSDNHSIFTSSGDEANIFLKLTTRGLQNLFYSIEACCLNEHLSIYHNALSILRREVVFTFELRQYNLNISLDLLDSCLRSTQNASSLLSFVKAFSEEWDSAQIYGRDVDLEKITLNSPNVDEQFHFDLNRMNQCLSTFKQMVSDALNQENVLEGNSTSQLMEIRAHLVKFGIDTNFIDIKLNIATNQPAGSWSCLIA